MAKCKFCKKEFEPSERHILFCSHQCRYDYNKKKSCLISRIKILAKKFNFEIKNFDKIVNAKMMLFYDDDVMRCPCHSNSKDHYCGSAQCIADVINNGHCSCMLFHKKDVDSNKE